MMNRSSGASSTETPTSGNGITDRQVPFQTHSAPVFVQNAEELIRLLANESSPSVRPMQIEAERLAERFRAWAVERPANAVRVAMIQELFELNRRARDHLSKIQKPVSQPGEVPNVQGFLRRLFKR